MSDDKNKPYRSPSLDDEGQVLSSRKASGGPPSEPPASGTKSRRVDLGEAFKPYGEQSWSTGPVPERKWLLTRKLDPGEPGREPVGFLPMGKVGMVAAAGGAGKTMALLQLAVSVATGRPWLGKEGGFDVPADSQGMVCLLLAEEDQDEVKRRLTAVKDGLGLSPAEWERVRERLVILPFAGEAAQFIEPTGQSRRPQETEFFERFKQQLELPGREWKLIVLDPLSRLATEETEVDNHHATRFVATIEQLVKVPGNPTVLVAHHTSKSARSGANSGTASAARGASGLTDGVRWVATIEELEANDGGKAKGKRQLTLSLAKHNYNAPAEPRPLVRGEWGVLKVAEDSSAGPQKANGEKATGTPAKVKRDFS